MTVENMRDQVKTMYATKTWVDRVNRMPHYQIVAVYRSWQERLARQKKSEEESKFHQMTIQEYLSEKEKTNEH